MSLIVNGAYTHLQDVAGSPVSCPMVDVLVMGAGGSATAWVDETPARSRPAPIPRVRCRVLPGIFVGAFYRQI